MPLQAVRLTPPGRGAVASVLVTGDRAMEIVAAEFHPRGHRPFCESPLSVPVVGRFGAAGEEVVVCRCDHASVEIHGHGGTAAVDAILETLAARGAAVESWRDWIDRTTDDPIAAAAQKALAHARTLRTAAILLDQRQGALRRALSEIESHEPHDPRRALELCRELLDRAPLGMHLVEPWRVVILGRPNVGKSRLLNAIVGFARAIVHHEPGTTRDVVSAETALDGWPVELSDTAGLRSTDDSVEQAGVERAEALVDQADLVLLVFDRSVACHADDRRLFERFPNALVIENKADLPAAREPWPGAVELSAATGEGVQKLLASVVERLIPTIPPPGAAVPFTAEQVARLTHLAAELARTARR